MFFNNFRNLSFLAIFISTFTFSQKENQTVNYVLGNESFVNTFGFEPDCNTDETLRLITHLEYIEKILKAKEHGRSSTALFQKRKLLIEYLHNYIANGQFPVNYDYKNERRPCFIDKNGNICAVGYLIEQTSGRELAEEINSKFKYSYIHEMNDDKLSKWIGNSVLTLKECAMIQPSYGWEYEYEEKLTSEYALTSSLAGGVNLTMGTLNAISIAGKERSTSKGFVGLITGLAQLTLGAVNIFENNRYSSEPRKMVSMFNIGLGSANAILSLINLLSDDKPKSEVKLKKN